MNRLQERRLALGLSQPQLSEILKAVEPRMDVGMVSRLERGVCLPSPKVLKALETALQASASDLFGEDELAALEALGATEPLPDPPVEVQRIVKALGYGCENALSRPILCKRLGLSDRKVREDIEKARRFGNIIINSQDGQGYYLSDDLDEMERQFWQDTHRALSILARRKTIRARLKAAGRKV